MVGIPLASYKMSCFQFRNQHASSWLMFYRPDNCGHGESRNGISSFYHSVHTYENGNIPSFVTVIVHP